MCSEHFGAWRTGEKLTMKKNGQAKPTIDEHRSSYDSRGGKGKDRKYDKTRGRGAAAKDTAEMTMDHHKLLSALTADNSEPVAEEPDTPGYKFNQDAFDTLTAEDKKSQLTMLIGKLESKPAQLSRAMEVFKKMSM